MTTPLLPMSWTEHDASSSPESARDGLRYLWPTLLLAVVLLGGCDNSIAPFSEKGTYSVYGVLFPSRGVQLVRVKPVPTPVTKVDSNVEATVTLTNLDSGTSEVLRDSIVTYKDAQSRIVTHNFWTDTPVPPRTKYRLRVDGPHGTVQATAVTPTGKAAEITSKTGGCYEEYTVVFENVDDLRRVYRAFWEVHLTEMPSQFSRGDWAFFELKRFHTTEQGDIAASFRPAQTLQRLARKKEFIPSAPSLPDSVSEECWRPSICAILGSSKLRVRYTYLGEQWYGSVPKDSLTYDPLQSRDVKGGLGFFGGARRDRSFTNIDTSDFLWWPSQFCNRPPPDSLSS
ncbi:MAG: hypothetical protein ABEK84_00100 [Salinibacter sp.]